MTADAQALAASYAQWWALAGYDAAVQESALDWLCKDQGAAKMPAVAKAVLPLPDPVAMVPAAPVAVAPPPPAPMPEDLDGFMAWLATDADQPEARFSSTRILPQLVAHPKMLIVTDMPTQEDMVAGRLFSGVDHRLLTGMMAAIDVTMDRVATASLLLARPAGGIIDTGIAAQASTRLRHLVRLLSPGAVILLGDGTDRAFQQTSNEEAGSSSPAINPIDRMMLTMALPAPFVLLKHPERKAAAWGMIRQLAKR